MPVLIMMPPGHLTSRRGHWARQSRQRAGRHGRTGQLRPAQMLLVGTCMAVLLLALPLQSGTDQASSRFVSLLTPFRYNGLCRPGGMPGGSTARASAVVMKNAAVAFVTAPTWAELELDMPAAPEQTPEPKLTLYRDNNGWCPFCERVWLSLREKGISYDEVLINLYDKPQWYKDMVPTSLVPAVKFAGSGNVVWESEEIMKRLDKEFPETRPLFAEPEKVGVATNITSRLMNASMGLAYRSSNMTKDEIAEKRADLVAAVDALDGHLATEGPFLAGGSLSAADAIAVPMLERYAVQMPYSAAELNIRDPDRWPALAKWYHAMEALPSFSDRVSGDTYSWTAVQPVLMRIFGGQNGTLSGAAAARAEAADTAAAALLTEAGAKGGSVVATAPVEARIEAAAKLLANHEAVVADAVLIEPKSQKELKRLAPSKANAVDAALRAVVAALFAGKPAVLPAVDAAGAPVDPADVAEACRFVAARLCVPRDMGAPAAAALRGVLLGLSLTAQGAAV